jgi:hypothetical protein
LAAWNSRVGFTPGSGGSTLAKRTFASDLLPGAFATEVRVSPSFSLLQSGVTDQFVVCTSEMGSAVFVVSTMQADDVPGSGQLPWTHNGLDAPVESRVVSPGIELVPLPADAGLKLRREPKSVYVQSSVQSAAFENVIETETGTVGRDGS